MRLPHRWFPLFLLLPLATSAQAEIYKYYDQDGNLVLSDAVPEEQAEKAEKLQPREVMTVPAVKPERPRALRTAAKPAPRADSAYAIVIQSPTADATYRREDGDVPVAVSLNPSLQEGHRFELLLDGKSAPDLASVSAAELDRGSHELEARVVDANGKVLHRAKVTFHVHQHTVLGPLAKSEKTSPKDKNKDKNGKSSKDKDSKSDKDKKDDKPAEKK